MVGIVIVSHSLRLAEGLRDLAQQMGQGQVPLEIAAGIDDPANPMGTDAERIRAAIEAVYSPDGVVVMMDFGSALLSAETALEFMSPEQRANVHLCSAPLVEGTLAAITVASGGSDVGRVLAEAEGALAAKIDHLGQTQAIAGSVPMPDLPTAGDALEVRLVVRNRLGLHARPAANVVTTAGRYQADVSVRKGSKVASARSINQLATLGVRQGEEIVLIATGPDAGEALSALTALVDGRFGEEYGRETAPVAAETAHAAIGGGLTGVPVSPGIAIGPAFLGSARPSAVAVRRVTDVAAEWSRLQKAIARTQEGLQSLQAGTSARAGASEAAIFGAHQLILRDPALLEAIEARISAEHLNAEAAWQQAIDAVAADFLALEDEYLRSRAADVLDVGRQVLGELGVPAMPQLQVEHPSILVTSVLSPSDVARLDPAKVLGICGESGGATSHSAILIRALGIPAVAGLNDVGRLIATGQTVALDGTAGCVWLNPDRAVLADLEERRETWERSRRRARLASQGPAVTRDGKRIEVLANVGGPRDARAALELGAEGAGLFRTELLFVERAAPPTEEDQVAIYEEVARAMGNRPLVIRTLDVGGDKPISYLELGAEANPFLGQRGIRYCLDHVDIFKTQLRAILRVSPGHNVKLIFPMIATLAEVRAAKDLLAECRSEVRSEGFDIREHLEIGLMIEVPSAAAMADKLAAEVDFFSIGTNDLAQYVMAADRGNRRVTDLADPLQPAVLRLIQQSVQAAQAAGIRVGICGELAGDALATPVLVGLGFDELSMNAPAIPGVKAAIRSLTLDQARGVAREVLTLTSSAEVRDYLMRRASSTWPVTDGAQKPRG